ncbi:MAG: nucleotidyltransferase family protein [Nitrosomonas sp.]|nr:nucleotidyltransferase family protein [Nitrosomonas sp.]
MSEQGYAALVLAADRTGGDPVTRLSGTACKAFAPVGGQPMVLRVLDALADCQDVSSILLCGPSRELLAHCPELEQRIESGQVGWIENKDSPSLSAAAGMARVVGERRILLTTADHALLSTEIVTHFLLKSRELDVDATVGMIRHETIQNQFPQNRRTVIRLADANLCGCNLFTFNSGGRDLVTFWRQAESLRKRPWRLVSQVLGWRAVWAYLLGNLSLDQAMRTISEKSGVRVAPVMLPFAEAGIDVDKAEDLQLVESILAARTPASSRP